MQNKVFNKELKNPYKKKTTVIKFGDLIVQNIKR